MTQREIADAYFLDHRAKLLDVAAFLDRVDRARDGNDSPDFRINVFRECVALLADGRGDRTRRLLEMLSDPSTEPLQEAPTKGALGAPPPGKP